MAGEQFNLKLVIGGSNDGAIRALNQVVDRAQATGGALTRADTGWFRKTRAGAESVSVQLAKLQQYAVGLAGVSSVGSLAADLVRMADEMKGVEARVRLASGSLLEFRGNLAAIRATASESGTEIASVAALFNRVATPIKDMGGSATDAQNAVRAVGQALRISGASAGESSAAMLQFAQALGSGALRGEELNSILENAPRLATALAAGLGVTVGQLRELGAQGALTSQQVLKALQSQQGALASEAARLPQTVGQAWTNLGESVKAYVAEADKATGGTAAIAGGLSAMAANLPAIADGFKDLALLVLAAFGANRLAALSAYVGRQREGIATSQAAAAAATRLAEVELAVAQATVSKAAAELRATAVTASYTLATNEAASAEARRAVAARLGAANQAVVAASMELTAARTAQSAAATNMLGRSMALVGAAGRGLLALLGGWPGLIITGLTAAALAWDHFRDKGKQATDETGQSVDQLIKSFDEFASKRGPAEHGEELSKLKGKASELRDRLMDPAFRMSGAGKAAAQELAKLEAAISRGDAAAKTFINNRTQERGLLGLDKLKLDAGGLIDQDSLKSIKAFDTLYKDFVAGALNDNGQLKASALELKTALQGLFATAKTPAEFTGIIDRLGAALQKSPKDATLRSQLENAIEARSQAEMRSLNGLVTGLEARAQRTQALFSQTANIALAQFNQAAALAKVAAELRNDPGGVAKVEVVSRNAEVVTAKTAADQQIASLEQVAERKRQLASQGAADITAQANAEITAVKKANDEKIAALQKEADEGKRSAASVKDIRDALRKDEAEKTQGAAAARVQVEAAAARQIREVDAQTAQARAAIAQNLYDTMKAKAADALNAYKSYAQQVIQLDQQIVSNRLNTAGAVNALKREDMTPREQAQNLREELAALKRETSNALAEGKNDFAKELLQRQQATAQNIGNLRGDGIDPKAQREEAIKEITRIGQETDSVLQAQRDAAASAAEQQLAQFNQMTQAMNGLAQQITTLNEQAAIKLKPEIDQGALGAAVEAVKAAFAGLVLPVRVQATGLPDGATATAPALPSPETPARAYGGPLPGNAPHDRADNMLYWGTPGEWVIQRPATRYYGAAFMAAVNEMRLPKYAYGGAIGRLPSLPRGVAGERRLAPAVFNFPGVGSFPVQTSVDVRKELERVFRREALSVRKR